VQSDAKERRTFSNIVAEFTSSFDADRPLKIIGGQHRFKAIKEAGELGINEYHGVKVYFALSMDQRLDVQLISNTNIAASTDLFDRMQETQAGPHLRNWCQDCGLLAQGQDFADRRRTGSAVTVRAIRSFILNYFKGGQLDANKFDRSETMPSIVKTGQVDPEWETLRKTKPSIWQDPQLREAGKKYSALVEAQRNAFKGRSASADFENKALNSAIMTAWAYVAGVLRNNRTRLERHFNLMTAKGKDPLNAAALAKGRHKTDPENYRGLGYRTDAKERGRLVELFYLQAEKGTGITPSLIDLAIKKYHAKRAILEVAEAEEKREDVGR
jgi:hypothetical protein